MKAAYFDCFSGASGDMIVGALLDAGADLAALRQALATLGPPSPMDGAWGGCRLEAAKVRRGALAATKFDVLLDEPAAATPPAGQGPSPHADDHHHDHAREIGRGQGFQAAEAPEAAAHQPHRRLADIERIILAGRLPGRAAERAVEIFRRLGAAEARVHGIDVQEVDFHEVGAVDSIADIVAAAVCLELLGIERVLCSPLPLGSGRVRTAHGVLPVPAPATVELLKGAAIAAPAPDGQQPTGELTTPTGAAILATLAESFGPPPEMTLEAVGYGAGSRGDPNRPYGRLGSPDGGPLPNVLRVLIGQEGGPAATADTVIELSANIDDCTGEVLGAAIEKLLAAGCVDAWAAPICMKKSRPAWMLSALCAPGDADRIEALIFAETTTFGIRRRVCGRSKLSRRYETVETPYGPIRVKVGSRGLGGPAVTASPEFADCQAAAEAHGVSVRQVLAAAADAWRRGEAKR